MLKGYHRTSGTGSLLECLGSCQLVRARCLNLLRGGGRDQFWCETHAVMERNTYTFSGELLELCAIADACKVGAGCYHVSMV